MMLNDDLNDNLLTLRLYLTIMNRIGHGSTKYLGMQK